MQLMVQAWWGMVQTSAVLQMPLLYFVHSLVYATCFELHQHDAIVSGPA